MNILNKFTEFFDSHIRFIQNTGYFVAGVGAIIITRKFKLFTKFRRIEDVPKEFVDKNIQIRGVVKRVSDENIVFVDQIPPFSYPLSSMIKRFKRSSDDEDLIALKLAGLHFAESGNAFLKNKLEGNNVCFQLLTYKNDMNHHAAAVVYIRQRLILRNMNVLAVKMGFAHVDLLPPCTNVKAEHKLRRSLMKAQKQAAAKKRGIWEADEENGVI